MIVGKPVIISHGRMPPPSKTAQLKSFEQLETQLDIHRGVRAQVGHQTLYLLRVSRLTLYHIRMGAIDLEAI